MKTMTVFFLMMLAVLVAGCEKAAETPVPIEPVAETNEVEMIVPTELQIRVGEVESAVKEKLAELEELKEKVEAIPVEEMVEEQAEVIKGAVEEVANSLGEMMEELAGQLKELSPEEESRQNN